MKAFAFAFAGEVEIIAFASVIWFNINNLPIITHSALLLLKVFALSGSFCSSICMFSEVLGREIVSWRFICLL